MAIKITLLIGMVTGVSGSSIIACLPLMLTAFQDVPYHDFLVKSLFTIGPLFSGISSFFAGFLLDKWGRKVVVTGALLLSTTGIVGFFADSLYVIMVSRIFVGVGLGAALTGFTTLIGDYFDGRRLDKIMGLKSSLMSLGKVFFLTLGGILGDIDWHLVFLVCALPLFAAIGVWIFIDEPRSVKSSDLSNIKESLPKSLNFIFVLAFLSGFGACLIYVYTPFYLKSLADSNGTEIGLALTGALLGGSITAMFYQKLRIYLSAQTILSVCFLSCGVGLISIIMADTYYQVVAGLIIVGLGFGLFMPPLNALTVSSVSSSNRGKAVGVLNICLSTGIFAALIILQLIVDQIGLKMAFVVMTIFFLTLIPVSKKMLK